MSGALSEASCQNVDLMLLNRLTVLSLCDRQVDLVFMMLRFVFLYLTVLNGFTLYILLEKNLRRD